MRSTTVIGDDQWKDDRLFLLNDAVKKAIVNFSNVTIKAGGKNVSFSMAKMQHFLQNHHPNYWTGNKVSLS